MTVTDVEMYILTLNIEGEGEVVLNPDKDEYKEGTEVTLTPMPAENYYFAEWTDDYEGTEEEITITMKSDINIKAHFERYEAIFDIEIIDYDENIEIGEEVTVKYRVKNIGEVNGTQDIVFDVDGDELLVYESLALDVDDEYDDEFTWKTDIPGDYNIGVFGADLEDFVLVTVEDEVTEDDDELGFLSDYWWIIPLIVIAVVVGLVLAMKMGKNEEPTQPLEEEQDQQPPKEQTLQEQQPPPDQQSESPESIEEMESENMNEEEFEDEF